METISPFIVGMTAAGYYFNMDKDPYIKNGSYWIWLGTNTYWMALNINRGFYDMAVMFSIYCCFCVYALYKYYTNK